MQPFPTVRITATRSAGRVKLKLLSVRTSSGARVTVKCTGHGCPIKSQSQLAAAGKVGAAPIEFRRFERSLRAGVVQLRLVKLTGSAFARFLRDEYTTLPDRVDRPLYIFCDVHWKYGDPAEPIDPHEVAGVVREVFDRFVSMSIQHLLNEIGGVLLDRYPQVAEFSFEAQNRLWDTSAVSETDPRRRVFSDPKPAHGLIGLTVSR